MRRRISSDLEGRRNLGSTIVARLRDAGIHSFAELRTLGAAGAYNRLRSRAGRHLPVCYYLYSLEGALRGIHWDALPAKDKSSLREAAGLTKRVR